MNACMIAYTFYESDNRVMRYAEALAARGDQVDVVCLGKKAQASKEVIKGVRVFRIQTRVRDEASKLSYLSRILRFLVKSAVIVGVKHLRNPYSIVHVHSVPDFLVFAAVGPRLTGAKIILDIHDLLPEFYAAKFGVSMNSGVSRLLQYEEKLSASFAQHVIAPNHLWHEKLISRSVPPTKSSVIMNYPDLEVFCRRGRTRSDQKIVMIYPGSLNSHQGLDIAIRAFARISAIVPTAEFLIFGEGPAQESLRRLVSDLHLDSKVSFRNPLPLREIAIEMENADLGIVPKRKDLFGNEAFSTKVLEFMAMGVPVIVSDTKVDRFYFNDQIVSFFEGGNVESLANCMLGLVQRPLTRESQVRSASDFLRDYSWEARQEDYLSLVNNLVMNEWEKSGNAALSSPAPLPKANSASGVAGSRD